MNQKTRATTQTTQPVIVRSLLLCLLMLLITSSEVFALKPHYPLRSFYPTVHSLTTTAFLKLYDTAVIIDIRSQFEFDVIRINNAKHLPLETEDFIAKLNKYRPKTGQNPIIFYGNDSSSTTSFQAAIQAQNGGIDNIFVYDAGLFSLLMTHPEKVTLMATTPASPNQVISPNHFQKTRIDLETFTRRAMSRDAIVIDIRDLYDRNYSLELQNIRNIPMDALLKAISNRIWAEKKLLIFDADGGKTSRLQFFLQANGYTDYAFLKGGIASLPHEDIREITVANGTISIQQAPFLKLFQNTRLTPLDIKLLNLLISSIRFENYILIQQEQLLALLSCDAKQLQESTQRLEENGTILLSRNRSYFFFKVDPKLAWKGEMTGLSWQKRCKEFHMAQGEQD